MVRLILAVWLIVMTQGPVRAQWYANPDAPHYAFNNEFRQPYICTDGRNGAFFSVFWPQPIAPYYGLVGHVNANGDLSYGNAPWPHLLPADSLEGYRQGDIMLVPSEPPGTVIVVATRVFLDEDDLPHYRGLSFLKLDTAGVAGFGQVVVTDSTRRLHPKPEAYLDPAGHAELYSDGQGGLHVVVDSSYSGAWPPSYYNHLNSDGSWSYPWPGALLTAGTAGAVAFVVPDGYGGLMVFVRWDPDAPQFPDQFTVQRFDANGAACFTPERVVLRSDLNGINSRLLLEPGRVLIMLDSLVGSQYERRAHYLFCFDTASTSLWEPQGRRLGAELGLDTLSFALRPDRAGGFFHARRLTVSLWSSYHYDGNAELVNTAPPGRGPMPRWGDGTGGACGIRWSNVPTMDPQYVAFWRWDAAFQPAWPDSVLAYRRTGDRLDLVQFTVCEDHGVIGVAPSAPYGLALFHINADGTLGPRTAVELPRAASVREFRIETIYPNPFNSTASIELSLPIPARTRLTIINVLGRMVREQDLGWLPAGEHHVRLEARELGSGIYFVRAEAGGMRAVRKVALVR